MYVFVLNGNRIKDIGTIFLKSTFKKIELKKQGF